MMTPFFRGLQHFAFKILIVTYTYSVRKQGKTKDAQIGLSFVTLKGTIRMGFCMHCSPVVGYLAVV